MRTLLKETIHIYILTGLILFTFLILYCDSGFNYYNFVNVLLLITYTIILWCAIGKDKEFYTYGRLALTVFLYSIIFEGIFLDLSYFYTGNTFYWDYSDPYNYAHLDKIFVDNEISFFDQPDFITKTYSTWDFADWGASMSQTLFLNLIPSRYFLFFSQTVMGTLGAMLMFGIGKKIMQIDYAYMAALSYSISSFTIYYYASFRKEIFMVFIVIASFGAFYQFISSQKKLYLFLAIFITTIMFFFRPVVVFLIFAGMASYFLTKRLNKDNARPILFVLLIILGFSFSFISEQLNSFSEDLSKTENYVDTTNFGIMVSTIGVLIGPWPQLLQIGVTDMSQLPLYGPGLLLKFILFFAFWNGFVLCLKKWDASSMPIYIFTVLEMLALAVANDGLELRKAMPHISTFYIAVFWFISKYDNCAVRGEEKVVLYPFPKVKPEIILFGTTLFVFFSTFIWNTMRK